MLRQGLDPCRYPRLEYSLTRNTFQGIKNEIRYSKPNHWRNHRDLRNYGGLVERLP